MTWNAVKTWAFGDPWTVSDVNAYLRDDTQHARDSIRLVTWSSKVGQAWNNGASAVFADHGGASYNQTPSFVKRQASTDLHFKYYGSCWLSIIGEGQMGVKVGATTYNARVWNFSVAANHDMVQGQCIVTGLAAGTYTGTLQSRTVTGGGAITTDANDSMNLEVYEVSTV